MKRIFRTISVMVVVTMLTGCSVLGINVGMVCGSGNVVTESRQVSGFTEIVFTMSGDVTIEQNGTEALTIQAEDNIIPLISTQVLNNRLTIRAKDTSSFSTSKPLIFKVSVKDLSFICASGSGDIRMDSVKANDLHADTSGSGNLTMQNITANTYTAKSFGSGDITSSGIVNMLNVEGSGSGSYDGRDLDSVHAKVVLSGSGNATVRVTNFLTASVSGSGSVRYIGDPTVEKSDSGSGEIVQLGSR